jgi:hypothetical protein
LPPDRQVLEKQPKTDGFHARCSYLDIAGAVSV